MRHVKSAALAALLATAAAVSPAAAAPFTDYRLLTEIAVPSAGSTINPLGTFRTYDISFFDPTTRIDYVADRSNAGVDAFSGATFLGRAPGFAGQVVTNGVTNNGISGPDGVLTVSNSSQHTLFAGDGPSLLRTFNISSGTFPPPIQFPPISTGGTHRVDEMSYSPSANLVLVANNADAPAFGTLVNASTGAIVHGHIVIPGAAPTDGLEQSVWDPATGSFFISVPVIDGGPGGVAEIKTDGTVSKVINFGGLGIAKCSPTGLALGGSGHLIVGCSATKSQTVLLDPVTGSIVNKFTQISGSDEVWYDPKTGDFYVTGVNSAGQRVFDIINDLTQSVLQSVSVPNVNAHSISVDPGNGFVYLPLAAGATNNVCPNGCIAVYGVPEPGTLPIMILGMTGLVGLAVRRRMGQ